MGVPRPVFMSEVGSHTHTHALSLCQLSFFTVYRRKTRHSSLHKSTDFKSRVENKPVDRAGVHLCVTTIAWLSFSSRFIFLCPAHSDVINILRSQKTHSPWFYRIILHNWFFIWKLAGNIAFICIGNKIYLHKTKKLLGDAS